MTPPARPAQCDCACELIRVCMTLWRKDGSGPKQLSKRFSRARERERERERASERETERKEEGTNDSAPAIVRHRKHGDANDFDVRLAIRPVSSALFGFVVAPKLHGILQANQGRQRHQGSRTHLRELGRVGERKTERDTRKEKERDKEKETDRERDRQTDRQRQKEMERQTDRQTDRQTETEGGRDRKRVRERVRVCFKSRASTQPASSTNIRRSTLNDWSASRAASNFGARISRPSARACSRPTQHFAKAMAAHWRSVVSGDETSSSELCTSPASKHSSWPVRSL
jgi:hypothetical protein